MANCKDCLCVDVCKMRSDIVSADYYPEILKKKFEEECNCPHFKDRNRFVELPCKVGDVVYSYCEELYRILPYFIEQIIISYDSDSLNNEYVTFNGISSNASELLDDMDFTVDEIGKTVFLTREEAERALNSSEKANS